MEEVTPEQRARRLAKLKKCLALSSSPEPHEAAAAMRQAQKLMQELGITAEQAEAPEVHEAEVKTREGYGNCRYMNLMASLLEDSFGVQAIYSRNPGTANRLNVVYHGPEARVKLAEYTHRVLQRALDEAWAKFLAKKPWLKSVGGKRQAFYMGWLFMVRRQVSKLTPTTAESDAVGRYIARKYGKLSVFDERARTQELDAEAMRAGATAAAEFALNVPVEQEQLKLGQACPK